SPAQLRECTPWIGSLKHFFTPPHRPAGRARPRMPRRRPRSTLGVGGPLRAPPPRQPGGTRGRTGWTGSAAGGAARWGVRALGRGGTGPLAEPRGGIFMRYATLAFESPNSDWARML